MTNGAKVYVCGLASDDVQGAVDELNALGKESGYGGVALGFVFSLVSLLQLMRQLHVSASLCKPTRTESTNPKLSVEV